MRSCRERASLPCLVIHDIRARPWHVPLLMMFKNLLTALSQHRQCNAETAICGFGPGYGLKKKIDWSPTGHRGKLSGDVRQAAGLRWNVVRVHETCEAVEDRANCLNGIRSGIHADHRVPAPVEQAFKTSKQN